MEIAVAAYASKTGCSSRALIYLPDCVDINVTNPNSGLLSLPFEVLVQIFRGLHPISPEGVYATVDILDELDPRTHLSDLMNMALTCKTLMGAALLTKVVEVFSNYRNSFRQLPNPPKIMRLCEACGFVWPRGGFHSKIENWGTNIQQALMGFKQTFSVRCPGQLLFVATVPRRQSEEEMMQDGIIIIHHGLIAQGPRDGRPMGPCQWLGDDYEAAVGVHDWRVCETCMQRYGHELIEGLNFRID